MPLPFVTLCNSINIDTDFKVSLFLSQVLLETETLETLYGWQCSVQHIFFPLKKLK